MALEESGQNSQSPATPAFSEAGPGPVLALTDSSMEPVETQSAALAQLELSCETALQQFCGPQQYLLANLQNQEAVEDFSQWLRATFPEADDCLYSDKPLSKVSGQNSDFACHTPLCLHVSMLGFTRMCTLKPPPGSDHCKGLMQEFLKDGFLTSQDPLLVLEHNPDCAPFDVLSDPGQKARAFSLGYFAVCLAQDQSLEPALGSR